MVNIRFLWLLTSIWSNIFLLTARNIFRTQIIFNEFSLPFCEEVTTHVFPQDGRGELWNLWAPRYGDTWKTENRQYRLDKPTRMWILQSHRENSSFNSLFCDQTEQPVYCKIIYHGFPIASQNLLQYLIIVI